jgi:hypothetical protein
MTLLATKSGLGTTNTAARGTLRATPAIKARVARIRKARHEAFMALVDKTRAAITIKIDRARKAGRKGQIRSLERLLTLHPAALLRNQARYADTIRQRAYAAESFVPDYAPPREEEWKLYASTDLIDARRVSEDDDLFDDIDLGDEDDDHEQTLSMMLDDSGLALASLRELENPFHDEDEHTPPTQPLRFDTMGIPPCSRYAA